MANIAWTTESMDILIEKHSKHCPCSYCEGDFKLHFGLNLPKVKKPDWGWKVIKIFRWYIRWVGFHKTASFTPANEIIKEAIKDSANFNINQQPHGGQPE